MLKNYLKIAWRNLLRNKASSIINIGGLAAGMAVAILIGLWVYDELSYNKYHQNYDRIGQVLIRGNDVKDGPFINNSLPYPLATELRNSYRNSFKHVVRSSRIQDYILSVDDKKISSKGQFMDEAAPEMLTLKMVRGGRTGLKDPHSILLSASTANALFGNTDPVNKVILLNNKSSVKVTGVYEDLPLNTAFSSTKFISSWDLWVSNNDWIQKRALNDWKNHFLQLFVEIPAGRDYATTNSQIADAELRNIRNLDGYKEHVARNPQVFVHPMRDWHLNAYDRKSQIDRGPSQMIRFVVIIGMFVLLLACINFMTLSTARSEKRAREVGIRKSIGSLRMQLIHQFFSESLVIVVISFVIACLLVQICLPWFNEIAAKQMRMPWNNIYFWILSTGFILLTGLLAGSYPALYLSSFKPVAVLKGVFRAGPYTSIPRKALVVLQFTVSVALIICTVVVYRQIQFGKDRPAGYDRDNLITIPMKSADFDGKYNVLRTEFLNTGVVAEISESMGKVTEVVSGNDGFEWKNKDPQKDESFATLAVTHDHGKTVGWQFVAGRDFSRVHTSDSDAVVINESAASYMELNNPVGEIITWKWRDNPPRPYTIIGVIKDMVMESPYEPIEPTMFFVKALNGGVSWLNIKVREDVPMSTAIPAIEAVFEKLVPAAPFEYSFVDQEYALKFAEEERIGKLAGAFALLAIFISCLGLFGLTSFMAERRTKEIGVRKVLGASVFNIWRLLSTEFLLLVIISMLIAIPVAYYFMNNWLENYNYRAALSWWIFAVAVVGVAAITLLTVSVQAIKSGITNPVKSLRME